VRAIPISLAQRDLVLGEIEAGQAASFFHHWFHCVQRWREESEENGMRFRCREFAIRTLAAAMAATWYLGIAGCGKTSAPEESAKSASPAAPIAGSSTKSQKPESPRIDPAAARDAALAAAVKAALAADPRLKSFGIDIRAADGAVELFGTVDTKSSRDKAQKIVAAIDGVKSVKSRIVLVSGS